MALLLLLCALTAVALLGLVAAYLILAGLPAIREIGLGPFLLGRTWDPAAGRFGILPLLLASLYATAGAVVIGVPVGFLTALFLARAAPPRLAGLIRPAVDLLSGVPSVVVGLVGMTVLVPLLREKLSLPAGDTLLAAVLVLAVMLLPPVIALSQDALAAVPPAYEEGSLALGATAAETWLHVTAPAAGRGLAAAAVLGVGRALGEATAVMMVAGNASNMPGLFQSVRFLTTAIVSEMAYSSGLQRQALFSIALVLYLFILLVNAALNYFLKRDREG